MASKRGKRFFRFLIFIAILVVAFITNPDKQRHVEKINDKLYDLLPVNEQKSIIGTLGRVVSDKVTEQLVTVDNYYLFSVSKFEIMGKTEVIGYGFFGTVIFTEKIREIDLR
jgi:hypothetical protein